VNSAAHDALHGEQDFDFKPRSRDKLSLGKGVASQHLPCKEDFQ
jgi:hypothetical protein